MLSRHTRQEGRTIMDVANRLQLIVWITAPPLSGMRRQAAAHTSRASDTCRQTDRSPALEAGRWHGVALAYLAGAHQ
jgi:hypothetical protein